MEGTTQLEFQFLGPAGGGQRAQDSSRWWGVGVGREPQVRYGAV